MYKLQTTHQFEKDLKRIAKQNLPLDELLDIVELLANDQTLPEKHKDHPLKGKYKNYRECHIRPDWLLIYKKDKQALILYLTTTGSHTELF
jgi:mRNA interferase YafQ